MDLPGKLSDIAFLGVVVDLFGVVEVWVPQPLRVAIFDVFLAFLLGV
jgi:hypothetical protein